MSNSPDWRTIWIEAGSKTDWRCALERTRLDLGAQATGLAQSEADAHWRLECAGPGAADLARAYHAALADRSRANCALAIVPIANFDQSFLIAWRPSETAALARHAEAVSAGLLARSLAPMAQQKIMLDALPFAAALVDRNLSVKACNQRAFYLFDLGEGIALPQARVSPANDADAHSLYDCVARALAATPQKAPALTRISLGHMRYPVAALASPEPGLCLLVIVDHEHEMRALWRGMSDLDAGELHLAASILAGPDTSRALTG